MIFDRVLANDNRPEIWNIMEGVDAIFNSTQFISPGILSINTLYRILYGMEAGASKSSRKIVTWAKSILIKF